MSCRPCPANVPHAFECLSCTPFVLNQLRGAGVLDYLAILGNFRLELCRELQKISIPVALSGLQAKYAATARRCRDPSPACPIWPGRLSARPQILPRNCQP